VPPCESFDKYQQSDIPYKKNYFGGYLCLLFGGEGDLAVMSIETYEEIVGRNELYKLIQEGIDDIENGKILTEKEVLKNMETALGK
jgi:hypothetical protein